MSEEKKALSQEKINRIVVGATVAGVLLAVFLIIVLIIQFSQMGVKAARAKKLDAEIKQYETVIESDGKDLEYYLSEQGMFMTAMENGYQKK